MGDNRGFSRRFFIKSTAAGVALLAWTKLGARPAAAHTYAISQLAIPGGTLDPTTIDKYVAALVIPPAMPKTGDVVVRGGKNAEYYEIAVRQFDQQILPPGLPVTTVWSYGSVQFPGTVAQGGSFNYPAFTIEATHQKPVRVKWINDLVDGSGNPLPHLLPVDQTLHWANPPGGTSGRDTRPTFTSTPGPYTGPVPIVTHLHGGHSAQESDGYAEAWFLPAGSIPTGFATEGTWYEFFKQQFLAKFGVEWEPGTATFQYENAQPATTMWYHDHTLGMTRVNVYAGPAGFYLVRGGSTDSPDHKLPGPAPALGDPPGTRYYEIPIAIQDRSFNSNGSLFFPDNRAFFEGLDPEQLQIPFIGATACDGEPSDVSPIWNPEFFGNTIVVNGRTWPFLEVEPRRYRFRFLNGCNARFLILKMVTNPTEERPAAPALPFWQVGSDGGFLPEPVRLNQLLMGLAERADVVVDFTGLSVDAEIYLINEGPDEPFGGGTPGDGFDPADPATTGQVMVFRVVPLASTDKSTPPDQLKLPKIKALGPATNTRQVTLNEEVSRTVRVTTEEDGSIVLDCENGEPFGPTAALLGTLNSDGTAVPLLWMDAITENPALNAIEVWEIYNFTVDAHPIHIHEVQFEVVNRQPLETDDQGMAVQPAQLDGPPRPPEAWETGLKDTVIAYPGEVTRVKALFDLPGLYVWHCHIVDHEDNEMMRPYFVGGPIPDLLMRGK